VAKWESGKTSPKRQTFPELARVLNIDAKALEVAHWRSRYGSVEDSPTGQAAQSNRTEPAPLNAISTGAEQEQGFQVRKTNYGYRSEFKQILQPLLLKAGQEGHWDVVVRGASTRWVVDYTTDKLVVNFAHAADPTNLSELLHTWIRMTMWAMVTMRKMGDDKRKFMVVITVPKDMEIDIEQPQALENQIANTALLQRITAEAAIMDIAIFTARTPAQVASLLTYEEELGDPS
jgi:hypothetical protein